MSLAHAAVNSSATTYPSVISVTCQSGYVLNERTDNEARCAHTGDWVLVGDGDVALEDCSREGFYNFLSTQAPCLPVIQH